MDQNATLEMILKTFNGSVFNKHSLEQIKDKHVTKIIKLQDKLLNVIEELCVRFEVVKIGEAISIFTVDEEFAAYNFDGKTIVLNEKYTEFNYEGVVSFAHELGHHIDITKRFTDPWDSRKDNILRLEVNAWYEALKILHKIGFDRWDYFIGYCSRCLRSYFHDQDLALEQMDYPLTFSQVIDVLDGLIVVLDHKQPVPDTLPY